MIGALISGGASILGGILGNNQRKKEAAMQREFAQNAIQWKVADAKKAGIHPLYALGAQTATYSPQAVGDFGLSQAGQDIGRAIDSGLTSGERATRLSGRAAELQLQNMELQNQKLASEIALTTQAGTAPPPVTPNPIIPGQGVVQTNPSENVSTMPGAPESEAALQASITWRRTPRGFEPVIPKNLAESLESDILGQLKWQFDNRIAPSFGATSTTIRPPKSYLPPGADTWTNQYGEWLPFNSRTGKIVPMQHRR